MTIIRECGIVLSGERGQRVANRFQCYLTIGLLALTSIFCGVDMAKKVSPRKKLYDERSKKMLNLQRPIGESNRYMFKTHYMLVHKNYQKLDFCSKVLLDYMIDWAMGDDDFLKTGIFKYSTTMLKKEKISVMSNVTCIKALKELEYFGFIEKANNATYQSGLTQEWMFSDKWMRGEKQKPKK